MSDRQALVGIVGWVLALVALWLWAHHCGRLRERDKWRRSNITVSHHRHFDVEWWALRVNGVYVTRGQQEQMDRVRNALQYALMYGQPGKK